MNSGVPLQELHKILLFILMKAQMYPLIVKTSRVCWVSNLAKKIIGKYMAGLYYKN